MQAEGAQLLPSFSQTHTSRSSRHSVTPLCTTDPSVSMETLQCWCWPTGDRLRVEGDVACCDGILGKSTQIQGRTGLCHTECEQGTALVSEKSTKTQIRDALLTTRNDAFVAYIKHVELWGLWNILAAAILSRYDCIKWYTWEKLMYLCITATEKPHLGFLKAAKRVVFSCRCKPLNTKQVSAL